MSEKSLYARILQPSEPNSLFAKTMFESSVLSSPRSIPAKLPDLFKSFFGSIGSSFTSILSPKANALSVPFDYGVDQIGFSLEEDDNTEDPYANADTVEPNLGTLNSEYGEKCFGTTVSTSGTLAFSSAPSYSSLEENKDTCFDASNQELTQYRMYIADTIAMKAATCYEGVDEQACAELGAGNNTSTNAGSGATLDGVECPANIEPHPSQAGYFKLPDAPNGEYSINDHHRYGSKQLVCVLHSVALAYNQAYGEGKSKVIFGDLNAAGHKSHFRGVAVDVTAGCAEPGCLAAANNTGTRRGAYDQEATLTLGKLFIDTGIIQNIWYCDPGVAIGSTSGAVVTELRQYAESKGKPLNAKCLVNHFSHFHVDLTEEYYIPGRFEPS